jgi:(S)-mandelate dehydrogenase
LPIESEAISIEDLRRAARAPAAQGPGERFRVDLSAKLLGGKSQLPLAVAPTGAVGFGWPGRLWFQAYIFRGREYTFRLMQRARDCGYEALMITVDLPVGGKRERDNRNHFAIPFRFTPRNLRDFASRPRWAATMLRAGCR